MLQCPVTAAFIRSVVFCSASETKPWWAPSPSKRNTRSRRWFILSMPARARFSAEWHSALWQSRATLCSQVRARCGRVSTESTPTQCSKQATVGATENRWSTRQRTRLWRCRQRRDPNPWPLSRNGWNCAERLTSTLCQNKKRKQNKQTNKQKTKQTKTGGLGGGGVVVEGDDK